MTLRQLEYFFQVCENPRISEISRKLGISQPAISLAIKALEEEVDERLFNRIGKKLVLNERGRYFLNRTREHYLALQDAADSFKSESLSGSLHIAASKTFSTYLLPQMVFDFQIRYPQVYVFKMSTNSARIIDSLLKGEIDIGFVESSFEEPELKKVKIGEDELIVVTGNPELSRATHYIDTLLDKKWILREQGSGTRDVFLHTLGEMNLKPSIFLELPEFEEIKNILRDNPNTLSCISQLAVRNELEESQLYQVPLKNLRFARELFLTYNWNRYHTKLYDAFLDFIEKGFETWVKKSDK